MIRTESEYKRSLEQLKRDEAFVKQQRDHLSNLGLEGKTLERALHPTISFNEQLKEEIEAFENIRRGDLGTLRNLNSLGRWLIGARIAKGWTQKELAQHLEVSEAQVSRDERNEYHGIKVDRAQTILEAMNFHFTMHEDENVPFAAAFPSEPAQESVEDFEIPMLPPTEVPQAIAGYLRANPNIEKEKAENLSEAIKQLFEDEMASSTEGV